MLFSFKYIFYFGFWGVLGHFSHRARIMWWTLSFMKIIKPTENCWLTFGILQCFRHSDLANDRPTTEQFREKLPWFLNALPSSDCAKGGNGAYTTNVELEGWSIICIFGCFFWTWRWSLQSISFVPLNQLSLIISLFFLFCSSGYEDGIIKASAFRTYHTPLNKQVYNHSQPFTL